MKIRIVQGGSKITSKGDIIFHSFDGDIEFNALGKNDWHGEQGNDVGIYEEKELIKFENNECTCEVSTKAKNFKALVELVKQAEEMLIQNGYNNMGDRISIIRGIYYGTEWSLDYNIEKSSARNLAFNGYTGSNVKSDARIVLKCSENCKANLFKSLFDSSEVFENSYKAIDFGHLIIGLDSRRNWRASNIPIPTQGGTGLELNTWVGDLGGGTANLSRRRIKNPKARAKSLFPVRGHSYGAMVNLEVKI